MDEEYDSQKKMEEKYPDKEKRTYHFVDDILGINGNWGTPFSMRNDVFTLSLPSHDAVVF